VFAVPRSIAKSLEKRLKIERKFIETDLGTSQGSIVTSPKILIAIDSSQFPRLQLLQSHTLRAWRFNVSSRISLHLDRQFTRLNCVLLAPNIAVVITCLIRRRALRPQHIANKTLNEAAGKKSPRKATARNYEQRLPGNDFASLVFSDLLNLSAPPLKSHPAENRVVEVERASQTTAQKLSRFQLAREGELFTAGNTYWRPSGSPAASGATSSVQLNRRCRR
jgi:hypothetical protein